MAGEYINDEVFDQGLDYAIANGSRLDITSQVATSFAEATSTYSLGNKVGLSLGSTEGGASDGRRVQIPSITDGSITSSGTATHWALTDNSSRLLATGPLLSSDSVTTSKPFTLDAISITIRDATVT